MSPKLHVNMGDIPDFVAMEPGKHRARLVSCEEEESSKGNAMYTWTWEGIEGDNEGLSIKSYTSLLENAMGNLKRHLLAFGYDEDYEGDVDTRKLIGKTALLIVVMRKFRDRDTGEEREGSSVKSVLPDTKAKGSKVSTKPRVTEPDEGSGEGEGESGPEEEIPF